MNISRRLSGHVVLADRIYVFGGLDYVRDSIRALDSVEYYDPLADKWEMVAPMRHSRNAPAACVSNRLIYVFGGSNWIGKLSPNNWEIRTAGEYVDRSKFRAQISFRQTETKFLIKNNFFFSWNSFYQFQDLGSVVLSLMVIGFISLAENNLRTHLILSKKSTLSPARWLNWRTSVAHAMIVLFWNSEKHIQFIGAVERAIA